MKYSCCSMLSGRFFFLSMPVIGVSAGEMSVTFLGNDEYRVYVELGPAIREVNEAEHHCGAGHIVLSPTAWELCSKSFYNYELLPDQQHARVSLKWLTISNFFIQEKSERLRIFCFCVVL